jgi:hypothetical protein
LTVILRGERMPGTEDGPGPVFAAAIIDTAYGGYRRPAGAGQPTWRRRARQGFRPRGRDMAAAPESNSGPPPPASVLVVVPVSVTHPRR